jgi:hypothetical protein
MFGHLRLQSKEEETTQDCTAAFADHLKVFSWSGAPVRLNLGAEAAVFNRKARDIIPTP